MSVTVCDDATGHRYELVVDDADAGQGRGETFVVGMSAKVEARGTVIVPLLPRACGRVGVRG